MKSTQLIAKYQYLSSSTIMTASPVNRKQKRERITLCGVNKKQTNQKLAKVTKEQIKPAQFDATPPNKINHANFNAVQNDQAITMDDTRIAQIEREDHLQRVGKN